MRPHTPNHPFTPEILNSVNKLFLLTVLCCFAACQTKRTVLYQSRAFTLNSDGVAQGEYQASVLSRNHLKSDYQSQAAATYSRLVTFKFSINEKDNELPPGKDHWVIIGEEQESPLITFGAQPTAIPEKPATFLPVNYEYTFRVDMTPVIQQFEKQGYYEAFDGTRVAKADFKGFYIAGGAEPLTWDFVNLGNQGLKLEREGQSHIYRITLKLNPQNEAASRVKTWKPLKNLSERPRYRSDQPIVDALFNLSLDEALQNIEPDSTFRTGAKWGGVWTRDISYSILLAFAYHEPEVAKISLRKKVKRGRIVQDTGSGGAWPVSSDRTTWALAAWEIYKVTGDRNWLSEAFQIIKNSLADDEKTIFNEKLGLYSGESSFLDWREQTYPKWMSNMDIYVSQNLGTNVVHYQARVILAEMAKQLGEPHELYAAQAESLKKAINQHFWMAQQGYYAQYLYGRPNLNLSPRFEALGEALAVIFGVANEEQAQYILSKSPLTDFGVTCIYPQIPGIPPYHNNAVWPFVQSYWNLAAAKAGNEQALNHGLAAIYRAGALFLTNYENFVAETGDFEGTEINSDRMLWSMAGNLAMVHRVFIGMSFETDGIRFNPVIPQNYAGKRTLSRFKYRNAELKITVNGFGRRISRITLDGKPLPDAFLPADIAGKHRIDIEMDNQAFHQSAINLTQNHFSLPAPQVKQVGNQLQWEPIPGAELYRVYRNGLRAVDITLTQCPLGATSQFAEYKVSAFDKFGFESFTSEPIYVVDQERVKTIQLEAYLPAAELPYTNFSGAGFVETSTTVNRSITCTIDVPDAAEYLLDIRYSNGSGPWNTDNKCAIRSLELNGTPAGVLVFPQRGKDEWSDWGYSNSKRVRLRKGKNALRLTFEDWNNNMNVDVNTAMLDCIRLIRL